MRRASYIGGMSVLGVTLVVIAAACAKDRVKALEKLYVAALNYTRVEAEFCQSPPVISKQKVKYIFLIDESESNQPTFPLTPGDVTATDPSGRRRFGPLVQFLRDLPVDPNQQTSFALITFNDNGFLASGTNGFDPSRSNFESTVAQQWIGVGTPLAPQPNDRGFTNYVSAMAMALQLIKQDAQNEAASIQRPIVTSAYRLIFVSDGEPRVTAGTSFYTQQFDVDILPQINNILSLKNDPVLGPFISDIILHTAYYFTSTQIPAAIALLSQMANAGNGMFMKFGAGENVLYGAFAPPVREVRQLLADVFLENKNAMWWDDGLFQLDADGDGLPERLEDENGSDARMADTDGNGVSDFVEYRLKGRACEAAGCTQAGRNPYSVCDGLGGQTAADGTVTFADFDHDGLNDCEEFLLRSDRTKFDSNGDFIPDFIALKAGVPFIAGVDGSYVQPQGDGLWSYNKIKLGLPIQLPRDKVLSFKSRVTTLTKLDRIERGERECYHLKVDPVAVLGPNNVLRLYVIENTAIIDDKPTLRVGEKRVEPNTRKVVFTDGDLR